MKIFRTFKGNISRHADLWIVFFTGVLLRIQYVLSTNPETRAYDVQSHMEYITHVLKNMSIPLFGEGWEAHQPPLYYALSALWIRAGTALGRPVELAWNDLQLLSLFLSVVTLGISLWLATLLFPKREKQGQALLFLGILTVLPGILFMSSRISNDALVTPLMFAFVGALLQWWRTGRDRWWYACMALMIAGLLTKLTMLVLLGALVPCLFLHKGITWRKKVLLGETGLFLIILCTGWFFFLRISDGFMMHMATKELLGMNGQLAVPATFVNMMSFSPLRILSTVYNNPWNDNFGRQYFWEYFFKSAFVGEWQLAKAYFAIHWTMMLGGLIALGLAVFGIVRSVRRKAADRLPLLSILLSSSLVIFLYRWMHSASVNQDFRFAPMIAIPIAALAMTGLDALSPLWKWVGMWCLFGFILACGLTVMTLSFV